MRVPYIWYDLGMKRFLEWIELKENLHDSKYEPPLISEREIWWASIGENIGSEINGKSDKFTRPAIILKKLARGFYLVAPTTTQHHDGNWYVKVRHAGIDEYVCLHQIRTVDYRRLYSKIGQIDDADFIKLKRAFLGLYE